MITSIFKKYDNYVEDTNVKQGGLGISICMLMNISEVGMLIADTVS